MSSYEKDAKPVKRKRGRPKKVKEPTPAPAPAPEPVKKSSGKMTDAQRADLSKHMAKMKSQGMSPSELKSHRMKLMSRMRKGMSASQSHADVMKSK
jgi:hypothetical protein